MYDLYKSILFLAVVLVFVVAVVTLTDTDNLQDSKSKMTEGADDQQTVDVDDFDVDEAEVVLAQLEALPFEFRLDPDVETRIDALASGIDAVRSAQAGERAPEILADADRFIAQINALRDHQKIV